MYPSLFPFLTQQQSIIPGSTSGMDHYGGLRRQDAALAEKKDEFGKTFGLEVNNQNFDQRAKAGTLLAAYGDHLASGTKEGRDAARAMRPHLELLGLNPPEIPADEPAAPGFAPAAPVAPAAAPGAPPAGKKGLVAPPAQQAPPPAPNTGFDHSKEGQFPEPEPTPDGEFNDPAIRQNIRDMPDSGRAARIDRLASAGPAPASSPVTGNEGTFPEPDPEPNKAPTQAPANARAQAEARAVDTRQIAPVAPPLMRGGLPVMGARSPEPIVYRGDYLGKAQDLHGIDPNAPRDTNTAQTNKDALGFEGSFPTEYQGIAKSAVAGSKSPHDVATKGKEARGTIEKMMGGKAAVEASKNRGALAERRLALAEGTQESTQFYKGVDLSERGMKRDDPKKALATYEGLEGANDLLANGNSVDQSLVYRALAMSVNVGSFTDKDAVAPDQFQSWTRKVKNYIETGTEGTLSAEEIADLRSTIAKKRAKSYNLLKNTYDAEMDSAVRGGLPNDREARRGWSHGMNQQYGGFGFYNQDAVDRAGAGGGSGGSSHKSVTVTEKTQGASSETKTVTPQPAGSLEKRKEALP